MPPHIPLPALEIDELSIQTSNSFDTALPNPDAVPPVKEAAPIPVSTSRKKDQYTVEEVARHNTKDDAWLIYNDKVLDITKWVSLSFQVSSTPLPSNPNKSFTLHSASLSFFNSYAYLKYTDIPSPRRRTNHPPFCWHGRHRRTPCLP